MALEYKIDVLDALKTAGYSTDKLRMRKLLSESVIQHLRKREPISWVTLERLCSLLNVQPGNLLEYDGTPDTQKVSKINDDAESQREFEYLWSIWNSKFRQPGETMADFHPQDYERYLPVPDGWEMPKEMM